MSPDPSPLIPPEAESPYFMLCCFCERRQIMNPGSISLASILPSDTTVQASAFPHDTQVSLQCPLSEGPSDQRPCSNYYSLVAAFHCDYFFCFFKAVLCIPGWPLPFYVAGAAFERLSTSVPATADEAPNSQEPPGHLISPCPVPGTMVFL